ncbi:MAG TPA: hypothetical protein VLD19_22075, partial [Chitinophagaceae bacterium]|nr:hypothetical protein [Chitinophagaceae bacterium]
YETKKWLNISYIETGDKNSYKNIVFSSFVVKDKTILLLVSGDLDNGALWAPKSRWPGISVQPAF